MSRSFRRVVRPEWTEDVIAIRACDHCNKHIGGYDHRGVDYAVREVTIKCETGSRWPEMASVKIVELDCCIECFESVVRPALEALHFGFYTSRMEY